MTDAEWVHFPNWSEDTPYKLPWQFLTKKGIPLSSTLPNVQGGLLAFAGVQSVEAT